MYFIYCYVSSARYRLSAEQGYTSAQFKLGQLLINEHSFSKKIFQESVEWYRKAAKQGHAEAQKLVTSLESSIAGYFLFK